LKKGRYGKKNHFRDSLLMTRGIMSYFSYVFAGLPSVQGDGDQSRNNQENRGGRGLGNITLRQVFEEGQDP
jgi:hypothetical protein